MYEFLYSHLVDGDKTFYENRSVLLKYRGIVDSVSINSYKELLSFFEKDTVPNFEVTWIDRKSHINKWTKSFASNRITGNYVSPYVLEPFVARYVIAINKVGIKTFYSCDGWHSKTKNILKIGFVDRNSMVWHKIISSMIDDGASISWCYEYPMAILKLPDDDENKLKCFAQVNRRAEILEIYSEKFLNMKIDLIEKVKGKPKNMLSDEELEEFLKSFLYS